MMFPVPQCTDESHVSSCFQAWMAAFKHPCPSPGRPVTRGDSTLAEVRWARDRAALAAFTVKSSTGNTKFWEADSTRESTLCHSFTHQPSESTCKPSVQHLIKAPLKAWTEHHVYGIVFKTADRSCSGSHGEACSPEASLQDGFLEGTIDEGLENKAAGRQKLWGWPNSGLLMNMNPHTYSPLTPWILLHVSKPAIYINRKTEATNCSQLTWTPSPWMLTIVKPAFFKRRLIILIAKLSHCSYIIGLFSGCLWVTIAIVGLIEVQYIKCVSIKMFPTWDKKTLGCRFVLLT